MVIRSQRSPMVKLSVCLRSSRSIGIRLLVGAIVLLSASSACAQDSSDLRTCNAAACEDEAIIIVAVDAALNATEFCGDRPARLLSTLHPAPYTSFADAARGRPDRRGVPSSPATLRLEDLGILSARRFQHTVAIVDSLVILAESPAVAGCLVVASPPSSRGNNEMRVIIAVSDVSRGQSVQRFIFLRREGALWVVSRHEVGYRS